MKKTGMLTQITSKIKCISNSLLLLQLIGNVIFFGFLYFSRVTPGYIIHMWQFLNQEALVARYLRQTHQKRSNNYYTQYSATTANNSRLYLIIYSFKRKSAFYAFLFWCMISARSVCVKDSTC